VPKSRPAQAEPQAAKEEIPAEYMDLLATPIEAESAPTATSTKPERKDIEKEIAVHVARETVSELLEKMNITASVSAVLKDPEDDRSKPTLWVDVIGQDLSISSDPGQRPSTHCSTSLP
jgi:hypothetical protein